MRTFNLHLKSLPILLEKSKVRVASYDSEHKTCHLHTSIKFFF